MHQADHNLAYIQEELRQSGGLIGPHPSNYARALSAVFLPALGLWSSLPTRRLSHDTGAAEAVHEWSGSRVNHAESSPREPKDAGTRGVWGHAPQKLLNFRPSEIDSGAFGTLFQHGKVRIQTQESLLQICYAIAMQVVYALVERSIELRPYLVLAKAAPHTTVQNSKATNLRTRP